MEYDIDQHRPRAWSDCFSESQPQLELNATQDLKFAAQGETRILWKPILMGHFGRMSSCGPVWQIELSLKFYICLVMKEAL